jgi:hypothetical protein
MQMSMTFQEKKVTRHVGEWILNTYLPTAYFGRIGEWLSTTLVRGSDLPLGRYTLV